MTTYLLVFHEGDAPEDLADLMCRLRAWRNWFEGLGESLVEGGNRTVIHHRGSYSYGGYCLLQVADINEAIVSAQDCPILNDGGRVELLELGDDCEHWGLPSARNNTGK